MREPGQGRRAAHAEAEPAATAGSGNQLGNRASRDIQGQRSSTKPKARPKQEREHRAQKAGSAPVVVKSIPDAKRSDRFYTSIRLPRELWDRAGFGPEDRLLLDWSGKVLTIERATEGGVKPKAIGGTSVVLQSWKLGNLNLDQPKGTGTNASLRLTGRLRQA